jgi:hypothetical protein
MVSKLHAGEIAAVYEIAFVDPAQPPLVLKVYSDELHWKILGRWLRWATRRRAVPAGARC